MKRRIFLLAVLGSALVMTACGNSAAGAEAGADTADTAQTESASAQAPDSAQIKATAPTPAEDDIYGKELIPDTTGKVSNGFMSITMPVSTEGTYVAYCYDNDINIYDKESKDAGFGGFAFGVCATENYETYGGMRTKIGELTEADGKLYHILISYPSDVQWDYTKGTEAPASYMALYDNAREIAKTLKSDNGGTYVDGGGTKGEDIYGDLVKDIKKTIQEAKDANSLEAKDLSPVYYAMTQGANPQDPMKDIGIAYGDINLDGVDEMVIADMTDDQVYDIYGCVDGKVTHVVSGNWRDYYKVNSLITEYVSESAGISVINTYDLLPNSTELFHQFSLKLDETEGAEFKWSVSYDGETFEELTEEDYNLRLSNIEDFPNSNPLKFKALGSF